MAAPLTSYTKRLLLAGGLLFLAMPALQPLITASVENPREAEAQRHARNTSAFAIMLGEFRASLSDLLFIKTERYLDRGVGYEPHVDSRAMASADGVDSHAGHDHGHDHDHHGHDHHGHDHDHEGHSHGEAVKTLIRTADTDFRGFIGHLEREVKPWRDPNAPHDHAEGKEMSEVLPWYRLATLSNPKDVRNYYIGAWWLKTLRTEKQLEEAVKFLDEGIQANPDAYELYLMKGFVLKDADRLKDARDSFRKSAQLGADRRPPGGSAAGEKPGWDVTNDEQLNTAIGMDVMLTRDLETTASGQAILKTYIEKMPDEGALLRMQQALERGN